METIVFWALLFPLCGWTSAALSSPLEHKTERRDERSRVAETTRPHQPESGQSMFQQDGLWWPIVAEEQGPRVGPQTSSRLRRRHSAAEPRSSWPNVSRANHHTLLHHHSGKCSSLWPHKTFGGSLHYWRAACSCSNRLCVDWSTLIGGLSLGGRRCLARVLRSSMAALN